MLGRGCYHEILSDLVKCVTSGSTQQYTDLAEGRWELWGCREELAGVRATPLLEQQVQDEQDLAG